MITDEDIKKITQAQLEAQKEIFFTKEEMDEKFYSKPEMDEKFSLLQSSVESFAVGTKTNAEEIKVVNSRVTNTENWIKQAAPKIGLEYKP